MKKILISFLTMVLALSMLFGTAIAYADDWPQFHHDSALSGYTESDGPDSNTIEWNLATGEGITSSPAIANGVLYVGTLAGNLIAKDAYDGTVEWTYSAGSPIHSSPAVDGSQVYFLDESGTVYALNAATGAQNWATLIGNGSYDWSSPAVNGGNVFIADSTGWVHSLNAATGASNWSTNIGAQPNSMIAVANGKVYSGTHNFNNSAPTLAALNEADGSIAWTYDYYLSHSGIVGMINCNGVTVEDGDGDGDLEVYFGVYNWGGVGPQAVCLDEATGTEEWAVSIAGNSTSTPAIHEGVVFIGSDDGKMYALDATSNGIVLWSYQTGDRVWSSPAVADGKVYFGSLDHKFYVVDEVTGALVWSYDTGSSSRLISSPAIADGFAYVCDEEGDIYAFRDQLIEVDKHYSETDVCFELDNDGDGLISEDPVEEQIDTDGDGSINEDPTVDGIDQDGDGFDGEDPIEPQIDNDDDGLLNEDPSECPLGTSLGTELEMDVAEENYQLEAVVKGNDKVSSYNPGQYYAVSTINVLEDVDLLTIIEDWDDCYEISELSPRNGGGSVVIVQMYGGVPVQILDAKSEEVTISGNEATVVLENVSAGTEILMYVKFAPGLKGEDWEGPYDPRVNYNTAEVTLGEFTDSEMASAMLEVIIKE